MWKSCSSVTVTGLKMLYEVPISFTGIPGEPFKKVLAFFFAKKPFFPFFQEKPFFKLKNGVKTFFSLFFQAKTFFFPAVKFVNENLISLFIHLMCM